MSTNDHINYIEFPAKDVRASKAFFEAVELRHQVAISSSNFFSRTCLLI